jgi:hypothetical protein
MGHYNGKYKFVSERLEDTAAYCIGQWYMACEEARESGDQIELDAAIDAFWCGVDALSKLGCCCRGATHFNIASSNEVQRAADYIEMVTGERPEHVKW